MTVLVIRYCHGVRHFSLDHCPHRSMKNGRLLHDHTLHDRARERRIALPKELEGLPLRQIVGKLKGLWDDGDTAETRNIWGSESFDH